MTGSPQISPLRQFAVLGGLAFAIFLVGVFIGYLRGASGDDAWGWAIKTGFLLLAMSTVVGVTGAILSVKLPLPPSIGWGLMMGVAFAIMNGGGVLLAIGEDEFGTRVLSGFLEGAVIGAIAGPFIDRAQKNRVQKAMNQSEV
jgi:hypothetical protein